MLQTTTVDFQGFPATIRQSVRHGRDIKGEPMATLPAWFPVLKDVVLFAIALWGAVLSTVTWVKNNRRDRRHLKVEASTGVARYGNGAIGPSFALIEVTNMGHRDVTVTSLAFELPNKKSRLVFTSINAVPGVPDTTLPATLKDGQRARLAIPFVDLGEALRNHGMEKTALRPICKDSADGVHRGKAIPVSATDLLR